MKRIEIVSGVWYYGKKILLFLLSLWVLSVAVFYLSRLAPGDPLVSYYGERAERMKPEERAWAREKLGLTAPISVQYVRWLSGALRGEFGISYQYKRDVLEVIGNRLENTLWLGGIGFLLTFLLALLLGVFCAWHQGHLVDRLIGRIGTVVSCIPEFWLSLLLILLFAVTWRILPSSGAYTIGGTGSLWDRLRHLILPLTVVVTGHLWYYASLIRNKLLEESKEEYVLFARAKGLRKRSIFFRHCLPGALPSFLSLMAISLPHMLGGTYLVELVFSYPGLGTLSYESARYQDYNLLMVLCLLSGGVVMLGSFLAQVINERLDPRIRRRTGTADRADRSGRIDRGDLPEGKKEASARKKIGGEANVETKA